MMTLANVETRRVAELVSAYEDHEITMHEFCECLERLSPEVLFVTGTFAIGSEEICPVSDRLRLARQVCREVAGVTRCRC
jgi:hypothetical protein